MDPMSQYLMAGQMGMSPGQYFSNQYLMNGANASPAAAYLQGVGQHPTISTLPAAGARPSMPGMTQGYRAGAGGAPQTQPGIMSNTTPAGQNANQGLELLMQALMKKAKLKPKAPQQNNPAPEPGANDLPTSNSGAEPGAPDAGSGDGSSP